MTSAGKRTVRVVDASVEHMGTGATGVMKSTKRISGQRPKATVENDENCSPSRKAITKRLEHSDKGTGLQETTRKLPVIDLYPGQILHPSAKIKLQLFPIDEGTRMGLEKDGFHPYLELTLSNRKKISSVLKHLNNKWGNSSVALGEPMLFPYNTVENLASYKWTINDDDISAADVYTAIGTPDVFRLRYGWFSDSEVRSSGMPSTSTSEESCLKSEVLKGCTLKVETPYGEVKQIEGTSEESKPIIVNAATNTVLAEKVSSDRPIDPLDNEVRMDSSIGQSSLLWGDSLTNISIGGLLSEASLQGGFNNDGDAKSNGTNSSLQPPQLISDSFDAFIAGQMNHSQGPRPPSYESHSSILDAEDTCHAFAFQKFSSSEKDAPALGGSASSKSCSQGAGTKSIKFPNLTEANVQSGLPQGHACQESETDLSLCSRVYNDESSLGLSGIKWTESLGPFDLGLSSSRKIISGDNISMSEIVN